MLNFLVNPMYLWIIVVLIFLITEIFTQTFVLLCFAFAALVTAIGSYFAAGLYLQLSLFSISALLSLFLIRPFVKKMLFNSKKPAQKIGTDVFLEQTYKLLETLNNEESTGTVKIGSEIWKVHSIDDEHINSGEFVTVKSIQGTTLYVVKHTKNTQNKS